MFHGISLLLLRALRLDMLQVRGNIVRIGFLAIVYINLFFAQVSAITASAPGLQFFKSMCYVSYLAISLAGILLFPTVITEDKESGMLDILRVAGFKPLSLVLGRSTGMLVTALIVLLLQFPFVLLSITLGGVTLTQIVAGFVELAAYLIMLANVGLLLSVTFNRSYMASMTATLAILLLAALGYAAAGSAAEFSILHRFDVILETNFNESPFSFHCLFALVTGLVCFGTANFWFAKFIVTTPTSKTAKARKQRSLSDLLASKRPQLNPFFQKDFHYMAGGWKVFIGRFIVYGLLTQAIRLGMNPVDAVSAVCIVMAAIVTLELCVMAARVFHEEIRQKTLPTLVLLPQTMRRIGYSKAAGCLVSLIPTVFWLIVGTAMCSDGILFLLEQGTNPAIWAAAAQGLMILHFSVLLSLTLRWWMVTLIAGLVAMSFLGPVTFWIVSATSVYLLIPVFALVGVTIVAVQIGIGNAVKRAARNC